MDSNQSKNEVELADSIFTPVMDVKAATQGFNDFQKLKMELLTESDIVVIMDKPHVKKSGWNKLALFFGVSTRTVKSEKTHNPDGSYEWTVIVEAYKKNKEGLELFNVQRSAIVSSLEKEQTEKMRLSPRKSHDVFASSETRAEGRALAAFFGSGEVSAEEMEGMHDVLDTHEKPQGVKTCLCAMKDCMPGETRRPDGLLECRKCRDPISITREDALKQLRGELATHS